MNITLKKPLVYVTRDIERALGMEPSGSYLVVSNDTPYGRNVRDAHPDNVYLVESRESKAESQELLDTYDLLMLPEVQELIAAKNADLVVFQNNPRIERLAKEKGWNLINPPAALSREVEEKISQVAWLGEDASLLPPHRIAKAKEVRYEGSPFVLQWNHSHTGHGTHIIRSSDDLAPIAAKFPERECRITRFVEGPVFTVNAVVSEEVIVGNPSYQITGIAPFTDLPFSTIGNDWELPQRDEYAAVYEEIRRMAIRVGERLKLSGWRGLFGIDAIYDQKAGRTYLLEINARQPASTTLESQLQKKAGPDELSIFEAHISALLDLQPTTYNLQPISGSQIVARNTYSNVLKNTSIDQIAQALAGMGLGVIRYENTEHNTEVLRIQSDRGIMSAHGKLDELGESIASCIRKR